MAVLTAAARRRLPASAFVFPSRRAYPIPDLAHARNALARVSQFGSPAERARVRAAVARRFPQIAQRAATARMVERLRSGR
jgi:hypothetical protein